MKALSIHPLFACLIWTGEKTVECRSWRTDYRGDILICSTAKKLKDTIPGHALCVVELLDVVPFTKKHLKPACMDLQEFKPGQFAWILGNKRYIKPIPLKGKLSLWNYDGDVEYMKEPETEEEIKFCDELFNPLFI